MLIRDTLQLLTFMALLLVGPTSRAHEGHDDGTNEPSVQVWTFADTGAHIHGTYVASRDGKVQVQKRDGTIVSLEIEKLTTMDQNRIEKKVAQVPAK